MRVMVAIENRFLRTQNGSIYSTTACDYIFWRSYLQVFDEVVVLARVADISEEKLEKSPANGPNVSFLALPTFIGPWQFITKYHKLNALAKQAFEKADAFILRVPGTVATLLWHHLMREKIPYGVEVVASSSDVAETCGANVLLRFILRRIGPKNQRAQCQNAIAVAYITKHHLQSYYPPGGWSTYYSDVDLPDSSIIDDQKLEHRYVLLNDAIEGQRPFRICHIGTMAALYKAQDVLMEAMALCRAKGLGIHLTLIGDGRYYQYFVEKAKALGLSSHVKFLGQLPAGRAVINQLDTADLFVFPSLAEGLGRALIEAMARGLPCIGSNVGGIPELLEPEDLVPPGDPEALAFKIESVLSDINLLRKMARRNLEKAKQYRADDLNKRRIEFHKKILEKSRCVPPRSA